MAWLLVLFIGLVAGTLSGIVGFGSTTLLLPILTFVFGPKAAVPIMAVAAVLGNLSRVAVWWKEIRWPTVLSYSIPAMPAAWLGARTMLALDPAALELVLGLFFIAMIPIRRWLLAGGIRIGLAGLALFGALVGYLTGIVANTGPINAPFFLAHGLLRGAFVGTEAMSSLTMFGSKIAAFRAFGALPWQVLRDGLIVGSSLMIGAWIAKRFMHKIDESAFSWGMDALLLATGLAMVVGSLR